MRCEQNLDLAAPFLHAMEGRRFDGRIGLQICIDPSSSEAISDGPVLESKHKIFLSHSGAQREFVDHLCKALEERCYYPFFDRRHESLPKGKKFPGLILKAAEQCQLFVVVISEEYFMSKWPMIELNAVVKATESSMNLGILPLFYGLSLSELKDEKRRQRWFEKWETFARDDPRGLMKVIIEKMMQVGASQLAKVKVVGLYGVGGIGKTTACKTLCNEFSIALQGRVCHIEFERTSSNFEELLQEVLIKLTRKSQVFKQLDEEECKDVLYKNLMKQITFLVIDNVLDNANSIKQAMVFLKAPYHQDSLVLVTARTLRTLECLGVDGVACLEMPELGQRDATNLFLSYAEYGQHFTSEEEMSVIDSCVKRCCFSKGDGGGLHYHPLALKALGMLLRFFGKNPFGWAQVLSSVQNIKDLLSLVNPEVTAMEDLLFFSPLTRSINLDSISPAAPVFVHDQHWEFSIDVKSTTDTAEPSSWLSLGRDASTFSPSILFVEGDMPSMSSGEGPSSLPKVPTTDLLVYGMDRLRSYLDIAAQCLVHVQEMPSRKFNNEQCGYLVGKLKVILERANLFLVTAKFSTSGDFARCIEVFKLLLALALKIESFIKGCCKNEWLQAAMTLTNTAEFVSSLGLNLELCRVYFSTGWTATKALTAAEVDNIERNEVEIVKRMANLDVDVLLDKVILELPSLQGEDKDLAIYLLQRLKRVKPISTSLSPDSPFWSAFNDLGFVGRIFQMVRQTELLGKGTSATVHKAVWLGTPVAKKTFYGPEHPDYVREAQILAGLCHPNIMSMFCCAMDKRKCSIVMELMDEDLYSFMQRRLDANPNCPPFSVFEAIDVILQISEGVSYLHENDIVHRDLKSFNVLVKNVLPTDLEVQYVLIKVADFGFAKIKESSTRYSNQTLNIGTNRWMPPEVINFRINDGQTSTSVLQAVPKYPKKSDVYSFGMVCYEILTGDLPFPHETSLNNIKKKVLKGERPPLPDFCPSKLKALIEECWDPEPTRRPSFASICSALKHLKCLLMSGFYSNEDSHVKIGKKKTNLKPQQEKY